MTQRATREDLAWGNAGTSRLSAPFPQAETVARPSNFYLDMLRREASHVMDDLCMKTSANLSDTMAVINTLRAQLAAVEDLRRAVESYERGPARELSHWQGYARGQAEKLGRLEDLVIRWAVARRHVDALNAKGGGCDPDVFSAVVHIADAAQAALLEWEARR